MKTQSIRFKTSVLYSSILFVILICFSFYVFHMVRRIDFEEIESDLKIKAEQIVAILNAYRTITLNDHSPSAMMYQFLSSNGQMISDREIINKLWVQDSRALGLQHDYFRIISPSGVVVLRSESMTESARKAFNSQFGKHYNAVSYSRLHFKNKDFYGIAYPFRFTSNSVYVLQLVTPLSSVERILSKLEFFIMGGIGVILLITLFVGSFITRRILKSVTEITNVADSISQKNLNRRIPEKELDQEMEQLVRSFNRMIERLENSFMHVNEFSSHVAHELKTPLAIIKNELELAVSEEGTREDDKRAMRVALGEIERLIKTIKDLLLLAKLEYQPNIFKMEIIDLKPFLSDICQHAKVLAQEKGIQLNYIELDKPVHINGDPVHVRRIFFNLIHNAVKYSPANSRINVFSDIEGNNIHISIKDSGRGIAPEDQSRIFEKFFRIRRMDEEDAGGIGLGLSMARAVARSHGGDITFRSKFGKGSTFTVILPIKDKKPVSNVLSFSEIFPKS